MGGPGRKSCGKECSGEWSLEAAKGSQQENRDLSPTTTKNWILEPHEPGGEARAPGGNAALDDTDCQPLETVGDQLSCAWTPDP